MNKQLCIFHIDLNFVNLRPDFIRRWLPALADMGYNAILWELEDKVAWETCRESVWPEAMPKSLFRRILDEASDLGLEAIPLLQTVGHAEYILKQPAYSAMRELPERHDCYCTENPETRRFLKQLISEYLELFGEIRRFHLGGDEAYVFARCGRCSAEAGRIGRNALYARHVMDISEEIRRRGVRPGIWCDMVLNHPEQMDAIPPSFDIWDWNYWDGDVEPDTVRIWGGGARKKADITEEILELFPEILTPEGSLNGFYTADALKRMGYEVILCSAARSSGDSVFCPRTELHARNIAGAARKAAVSGLAGTCVTDWAVRLNSWETHRSYLPLAPIVLNNPAAGVDETLESIGSGLFGCDARGFIDAVDRLSAASVPFAGAHSTAIQWSGMKDSLPAPSGYIENLIRDWETSGRLEEELESIDARIARISRGAAELASFVDQARAGRDTLHFWMRAAHCQLWQAVMAREILQKRRTKENAGLLREMRAGFEQLLRFDQTPTSAAQNAALVYDALIEYIEPPE